MSDRRFTKQFMTAAAWLLASVLIPVSAWAQAQPPIPTQSQQAPPPIPPGPLTLDQVLSLAEPRSEAVSIAVAAVRRAEGDQVRAQSGLSGLRDVANAGDDGRQLDRQSGRNVPAQS